MHSKTTPKVPAKKAPVWQIGLIAPGGRLANNAVQINGQDYQVESVLQAYWDEIQRLKEALKDA